MAMIDYEEVFNNSYEVCMGDDHKSALFFKRFYENFISSSSEVAKKFEHTDIDNQAKMLKKSFFHVLNYYTTKKTSGYLKDIARTHDKNHYDIRPHLYDLWFECLLITIQQFDAHYNQDVENAWKMRLTPCIDFMKSQYSPSGKA